MAGIDKTYTDSYENYKEFKDWADKQTITFFDGYSICVGDWVREYEKGDFNCGEIAIMNTPTWLDVYLMQNCKSEFVLERMKEVYGGGSFEEFKNVDLTARPPKNFKQNRKVIIKKNEYSKFPLHSKPYGGSKWWLQCEHDFWYNEESKMWMSGDSYYPTNCNTACISSIKGVIRHLRKQYLPKGISFRLTGRYVGEEYEVRIK